MCGQRLTWRRLGSSVWRTHLRLEHLPSASIQDKLGFVHLMKRWFDQRIHHAGPYDPMAKRLEFVEQSRSWGHKIVFPHWVKFDKEYKVEHSEEDARERHLVQEYNKMPEFQRLIYFLGD